MQKEEVVINKYKITCGGSGNPLASVRKSVYAPGASSGGGPGGGA